MDLIALMLDWINVVIICGATAIILVLCVGAIVYATIDTLHEVFAISNDCFGA
jgi:hypothetical protein